MDHTRTGIFEESYGRRCDEPRVPKLIKSCHFLFVAGKCRSPGQGGIKGKLGPNLFSLIAYINGDVQAFLRDTNSGNHSQLTGGKGEERSQYVS